MMKFGSLGPIPVVPSHSLLESGAFVPTSQSGLERLLQQRATLAPYAGLFDQDLFRQLVLPVSYEPSLHQLLHAYGGGGRSSQLATLSAVDSLALASNQASPDSTQPSSERQPLAPKVAAKGDAPKGQVKGARKSIKTSAQAKEQIDINKQILR